MSIVSPRPIIGVAVMLAILTPRPAPACVGDCKNAGTVDIADLIVGVNIALGSAPVTNCEAFANPTGAVDVVQLIAGVNNALTGCADRRFIDNGDGTITDKQTGLMWEKKVGIGAGVDPGNLHAADNAFPWAGECELEGDLCQPNAAAAAACAQWVQGDAAACSVCSACRIFPVGETTIWDWVVQLNAASFATFADWRIPTMAELESIADYTALSPAVDRAFNGPECGATCTDVTDPACSCTQSQPYSERLGPYWSATTAALPFTEWWLIEFGGGVADYGGNGSFPADAYVRAVRGGAAAPIPRFVDNGHGTITDKQTGLMWEKKVGVGVGADPGNLHAADNTYTWSGECSAATGVSANRVLCQPNAAAAAACAQGTQADRNACDSTCWPTCDLDPCATCHPDQGTCISDPLQSAGSSTTVWDWLSQLNAENFAGHADWRLPTEAELLTVVNYTAADPALDSVFGQPTCTAGVFGSCGSYWSATTAGGCPSLAWFVPFDNGETFSFEKTEHLQVRAVRGGS